MKKVLAFLAFAAVMNISAAKAYSPSSLLDDSASFQIAKSVKLGYGDASAPSLNKGTKKAEFNTCSSDSQCPLSQKCVNGKCEPVCTSSTCSGETPVCEFKDHAATCKCSDTSCGAGKQCVDGKCETCTVGSTCNCSGKKVIDAAGQCICPSSVSCSAGQYVSGDCSCKSCQENDTSGNKCGCPGNTVPDGSGSCYCKTKKTCGEGYSFDSTNTCECIPCTDNNSCDNPCPAGSFPNGSGCGTYVCETDENCDAGNVCKNGGTESAECAPCGKNEQCRCPDGQLSDGSGKCVPVVCKTGLVCSSYVTEQCCDAGMQCVNPDTVESYCAACEVDTQCTCPDGYVVNSAGKCVKPVCTKDGDCVNGNKCDNAGKSDAKCVPCDEGETCTCTGGMIADGKGGCKFGCEFESEAACKSGTANCSNCVLTAGCYVCTGCGDGYQIDGSTCSPKKCPTGYATDVPCDTSKGYILETNGKSGDKACVKCEAKACPDGYATDVSCDTSKGYAYSTSGYSAGKECGKCTATACPSGYSTDVTACGTGYVFSTSGYSDGKACGRCTAAACPDGYATDISCDTSKGYAYTTNGSSAGKTCGKCTVTACPSGYATDKTSCGAGYTLETNGYSAGKACGKCVAAACPDGYATDVSCDTSKGYKLETSGTSAGKACGKCTATACPTGYSTDVTACTNKRGSNYELLTNGYSGGKACGKCGCPEGKIDNGFKCVPNKTCAELGKEQGQIWTGSSSDCPAGYQDSIATGEIGKDGACTLCTLKSFNPIGTIEKPSCGDSQMACGSLCCPKTAKGCTEYENDCKSLGNGLSTHCRCIASMAYTN